MKNIAGRAKHPFDTLFALWVYFPRIFVWRKINKLIWNPPETWQLPLDLLVTDYTRPLRQLAIQWRKSAKRISECSQWSHLFFTLYSVVSWNELSFHAARSTRQIVLQLICNGYGYLIWKVRHLLQFNYKACCFQLGIQIHICVFYIKAFDTVHSHWNYITLNQSAIAIQSFLRISIALAVPATMITTVLWPCARSDIYLWQSMYSFLQIKDNHE